MEKPVPVVAERGRPETPEETAIRKATSSKAYRSSQTIRNLVAAMLVALAVVAVIVLAVPRGEPKSERQVDLAGIAQNVESTMQSPVIVPELGTFWRVNAAALEGGATRVWNITLTPAAEDERGFVKLAQAFDADASWAPQQLNSVVPTDAVRIADRDWDVYLPGEAGSRANIIYAIGIQAGDDYVLLYGSRSAESTAELAASLTYQLDALSEAP